MEGVWQNPPSQMDMYLDVTIRVRNTKALTAYFLERKQITETFFPKELDKL